MPQIIASENKPSALQIAQNLRGGSNPRALVTQNKTKPPRVKSDTCVTADGAMTNDSRTYSSVNSKRSTTLGNTAPSKHRCPVTLE